MASATWSTICRLGGATAVLVSLLAGGGGTALANAPLATGMWADAGCWPSGQEDKVQYFPTPEAACKSQQMRCDPDFLFIGAQATTSWDTYDCQWIRVGWLGGGGPLPGSTTFECPSGYTKKPLYQCVKDLNQRERPKCQDPESGQANPSTPNPISIRTGSKLLTATDFETADGLLRVKRFYRSRPSTNANVAAQHPVGLSPGWRFEFMPELHLETSGNPDIGYTYSGKATWHAADGSSYDFKDDNADGFLESDIPANGLPNGDFEVSRISLAADGESTWQVIEPDGTTWILKTYNTDQRSMRHLDFPRHNVARPTARITRDGYRWDYSYRTIRSLEACEDRPEKLCGTNSHCQDSQQTWDDHCDPLPEVPGDGELESIEDSFNRRLEFEWIRRNPNRMETPPGDQEYRRFLEIPMAIARITLPDETIVRYAYDSTVTYNFERNFYAEVLNNGAYVDYDYPPDRLTRVERWDAGQDGNLGVSDNNEVDPDADDYELDSTEYDFKQYPYQQTSGGPTVLVESHLISDIRDHRGIIAWHFDYDDQGRAILSERAGGYESYQVEYAVGTDTTKRRVIGPLGRKTDYSFDDEYNTRLTRVDGIEGTGPSACLADDRTYGYNSHGYINQLVDPEGRVTTYSRVGSSALLKSESRVEGGRRIYQTKFEYFDPWRILKGSVNGVRFYATYDFGGQLSEWKTRDRGGRSAAGTRRTSMTYTTAGLLDVLDGPLPGTGDAIDLSYEDGYVSGVDWLGDDGLPRFSMGIARDARGNPTDIWDINGLHTQIQYNDVARTVTVTQNPAIASMTAITVYRFTAAGDLERVDRADGSAVEYQYNDARILTKIIGGSGNTTPIAGGDSIEFALNDAGQPQTATVKTGSGVTEHVVSLEYNELMRVRQRTSTVDGRKTEFTYDKVGDLDKRIEPGFTADPAVTRVFDYEFDGDTHQVEAITEPGPDGGTTSLVYRYGILDKVTDDAGNVTNYSTNKAGELLKVSSPDAGNSDFGLNEHGLVNAVESPRGDTSISRDGLGRILAILPDEAPGEEIFIGYDDFTAGTEPNYGAGKLTSIDDESGHTAFKYDALGRPYLVERTFEQGYYETKYEYDLVGRIRKIIYPSLREVEFFRDSAGNVYQVNSKFGATTRSVAKDIKYQPFHPWGRFSGLVSSPAIDSPHLSGLKSLTYGNNTDLTLDYDNDGRLRKMEVRECPSGTCTNGTCSGGPRNGLNCSATFLQNISLAYYGSGHLQSITDAVTPTSTLPSRTQTFAYDSVGRLSQATGTPTYGNIIYDYDTVGNRTLRTVNRSSGSWTESYDYEDGSNRLIAVSGIGVSGQSGVLEYTADGSVELDTRPGHTYEATYNRAGRLESVTMGSDTRTYIYDAFGHRVSETRDNGGALSGRAFVYDLAGHLIAEYAEDPVTHASTLVQEYIWLDDTPIAMVWANDEYFYIHTDHLGSPQIVTNSQRNVRWAGYFEPFGEEFKVETPGTQDPEIALRFPGQEWDRLTKLSQNWHRDYDPSLGRYIESDPIGLAGGINTYAYAFGDPLGLIDPAGLRAIVVGIQDDFIVGGGVSAQRGFYFDTESWEFGVYAAVAAEGGVGIGKSVFVGDFCDARSLDGDATSLGGSIGPLGETFYWDPQGLPVGHTTSLGWSLWPAGWGGGISRGGTTPIWGY